MSFTFDVTSYVEILDRVGADRESRIELFLLSQASPEGRTAANQIVHKIMKKLINQEPVNNWSALITSNVLRAREILFWWLHEPGSVGAGPTADK